MSIPEDIIKRCKNNDKVAQQHLHQLSYAQLMQICNRYIKSADDADYVLNEAYFKIFTKIDTYNYNQSFNAWMRTIVINTSLDFIKSEKKHYNQTDVTTLVIEPTYNTNQPLDGKDLLQLLHSLPTQQQAVFNLFAIDGYSHKEIAEQLKISESNSKYLLFHARKALQEKVNKHYNG